MATLRLILLNLITFVIICVAQENKEPLSIDENGYILYCPCMGRFGNQADQFLGVLSFAKGINRTLVLPPWIEYIPGYASSNQIPFDTYFKVEPLRKYHRVMLMRNFMEELAPILWPKENRNVLCYMPRYNSDGCNAKEGNPFGPFWDRFGVDFINSSYYKGLHYDMHYGNMAEQWEEKYPPREWPVLAFTGPPAAFPVQKENVELHKYLEWNDKMEMRAKDIIRELPRGPTVGIHLRNGVDWERACEHIKTSPNLFAAPQCLGYINEHGKATEELCLPSTKTIVKEVKRAIKRVKATNVYVASDNDFLIAPLTEALRKMKINVIKSRGKNPQEDLAVLGHTNYFIGNCISSFTAFVKRARDVSGYPSSFFAFPVKQPKKSPSHTEL